MFEKLLKLVGKVCCATMCCLFLISNANAQNVDVAALQKAAAGAISAFKVKQSNANMVAAIKAISALQPYNSEKYGNSGLGVYDYEQKQFINTILGFYRLSQLPLSDKHATVGAIKFSAGQLYIAMPSTSQGPGIIYVFNRSGIKWDPGQVWKISANVKGDLFGNVFAVNSSGDTLIASAMLPTPRVYVFKRDTVLKQWNQYQTIIISDVFRLRVKVTSMTLAISDDEFFPSMAIGIPNAGVYAILKRASYTATSIADMFNQGPFQVVSTGSFPHQGGTLLPVAMSGNWAAFGYPLDGIVDIYEKTNNTWGLVLPNKSLAHTLVPNIPEFGHAVDILVDTGSGKTRFAFGCPKAGLNGEVWMMTKSLNPPVSWSALTRLPLPRNLPTSVWGFGDIVTFGPGLLAVSTSPVNLLTNVPTQVFVSVYKETHRSTWLWKYNYSAGLSPGAAYSVAFDPVTSGLALSPLANLTNEMAFFVDVDSSSSWAQDNLDDLNVAYNVVSSLVDLIAIIF